MLTSVKHEHLKSFRNHGAEDRPTPRLRHDDAPAWNPKWNQPEPKKKEPAKPIGRNCERDYLSADHKPAEFDPSKTGHIETYVMPGKDPEITWKKVFENGRRKQQWVER